MSAQSVPRCVRCGAFGAQADIGYGFEWVHRNPSDCPAFVPPKERAERLKAARAKRDEAQRAWDEAYRAWEEAYRALEDDDKVREEEP